MVTSGKGSPEEEGLHTVGLSNMLLKMSSLSNPVTLLIVQDKCLATGPFSVQVCASAGKCSLS